MNFSIKQFASVKFQIKYVEAAASLKYSFEIYLPVFMIKTQVLKITSLSKSLL